MALTVDEGFFTGFSVRGKYVASIRIPDEIF